MQEIGFHALKDLEERKAGKIHHSEGGVGKCKCMCGKRVRKASCEEEEVEVE